MCSLFAKATDAPKVALGPVLKHDSFSVGLRTAISWFVAATLACSAGAQAPSPTSRGDNTRSGANINELLLTPGNVNSNSFGHLFSAPIDYQALAQPLYMPDVNIPGQGMHNVVYVVTQKDSAYAFDADNGTQLWYANMTNGGVPASGRDLPCGTEDGFAEEGIVGTPTIDSTTNTIYLVAKSVINGTVTHYLHALDITTGAERVSMGSPVQILATSVSKKGHVTTFKSLHQKNRPGMLLLNGVLYLGFGSNGCNDDNTGWVLAYSAAGLQQVGAFNTSPDHGLTSIWQTGNGLAADEAGNIFVATAEGNYDVWDGGQGYSNSILKLTPPPWAPQNTPDQPADFFTPWTVAYLNAYDLDISSVGPLVLPDQAGNYPHEVIASGKQAIAYVLDRDNMGQYVPGGQDNVIQEFQLIHGGELMCSPVYWNGIVYFSPDGAPLQAFQVSNGLLNPIAQSKQGLIGAHSPSISANGNTNAVLWAISGAQLQAYDAVSLMQLYTSKQVIARDQLPPLAHFATQTVADGRVYVATQNSLEAYGLLHTLSFSGGDSQAAPVLSTLPAPLQVFASDPYSGQPQVGVTVSFSDGNKGGTFNPSSAVTNSSGLASTTYTFPQTAGAYALTTSSANFASATTTETATPLAPASIVSYKGAQQTGAAGSVLPNPIVVKIRDIYQNPVPGVTVNFSANKNGIPIPTSSVTNSAGLASTTVQLPTTVGKISVTATSPGLKKTSFSVSSVAGPPASTVVTGGNNQAAPAGTVLPQALSVLVADQYGNPVSGVAVTFSDGGAGGSFANANPEAANSAGIATQTYTLPASPGSVTITATVGGAAITATFTETAQ
ncbi:MAG: Ig-like domain-containing protein [Terriglobales bacterium]